MASPPPWAINRLSLTRRSTAGRAIAHNLNDGSSISAGSFGNHTATQRKKMHRKKSSAEKVRSETNFMDTRTLAPARPYRQSLLLLVCHFFGIAVSVYVFLWAKSSHEDQKTSHLVTICNDRARILAGLFNKNTNHVRTFQSFIDTLNRSAHTMLPARLPVFAKGAPPCQLPFVPRVDEEAVEQYLEETLFARPMVLAMGYGAFVPHSLRKEFETCMGFTIHDWHTKAPSPPREDYFVKTHGVHLDYLHGNDLSSMSDQHVMLWERVREADGLTISPPYVMVMSKDRKMGMGVAFPCRPVQLPATAGIEDKRRATIGCSAATVDFETMVDVVLEDLQQGRMLDIVMRIDDVTDMRHPVSLYEPSANSSKRVGLKPPQMLASKTSYSNFIPDSWKFREEAVGDDDFNSSKWLATPLKLGDDSRHHEVRCRYKEEDKFPRMAVILGLGTMAICFLVLQIIWGAIKRFEQMKEGYVRMAALKQAAEAGNTAKSVFLAAMTQEVRAPMQAMLGMINVLLKTPLDALQLDYARTAEASGKALIYLINDVLDYAKIESGNFKLDNVPFNIRYLIDDVLSMLSPIAQEKKGRVELAALVFDSVPTFLVGDPVRMRQVLASIVGNAMKFTEYGHVLLTVHLSHDKLRSTWLRKQTSSSSLESASSSPQTSVSASPSPSPPASPFQSAEYLPGTIPPSYKSQEWGGLFHTLSGREATDTSCSWEAICRTVQDDEKRQLLKEKSDRDAANNGLVPVRRKVRLEFKVEDTGIGIPENAREHIYLPFAQLEPSLQRRYGGTGIGLSLAQRLIHLMGGTIDFTSRLRVGTTFKFDIKVDMLHRPVGSLQLESLPEEHLTRLKGKKALVVDGRQVRQQVLASCLQRLGLQVELCDNIFSATVAIQESMAHDSVNTNSGEPGNREGWDVVLVDAEAGGAGTGLDLGKLLIRACETKNIPCWKTLLPKLILVACSVDDAERQQAMEGPFAGTLIKPVRCTGLAACLTEVFSHLAASRGPQSRPRWQRAVSEKKILVVGVELEAQDVLTSVLLKADAAAVVCVKNCSEALQLLGESGPFHCLFVNVSSPSVGGLELAQRIREEVREQGSPRLPVIGLASESAGSRPLEGAGKGSRGGMNLDACLSLPLHETSLAEALLAAIEGDYSQAQPANHPDKRSSPPATLESTSLKGWLSQW